MNSTNCPICKLENQPFQLLGNRDAYEVICTRCGTYCLSGTAASIQVHKPAIPKLSAWIRERAEAGVKTDLNTRTLEEIVLTIPDYRVSEKQLRLLKALERMSSHPGHKVLLSGVNDYPLAWATGVDELRYHLKTLHERGLIKIHNPSPYDLSVPVYEMEITAAGWDHIDRSESDVLSSNQAFVAMSFGSSLEKAWKAGIEPAILSAGYSPYRVDKQPHIDKIDSKIVSEIKNSRFVVADVTEQRPGVYFEAGYAIGLGKPVFWSVRKEDLNNVHFDTRQYNHIVWESEEHLHSELVSFITAVIGRGRAT